MPVLLSKHATNIKPSKSSKLIGGKSLLREVIVETKNFFSLVLINALLILRASLPGLVEHREQYVFFRVKTGFESRYFDSEA